MNQSEQTKILLLYQYERYPAMKLQDAVKLLYQSEFAGGHIIKDGSESLSRLEEECASLESIGADEEAFEDIGGGLCRLNLRALGSLGIDINTANRFFIETANSTHGSTEGFERKLDELRQLCRSGELPFDLEEAKAYLLGLKEKGFPAVSHSEAYRRAYAPGYRVVKSAYRDYIKAFAAIDSLLRQKEALSLAIDGRCGAGKSALAFLISGVYDCNLFRMDDFFLMPGQRTRERLEEAGGNVDRERFAAEVIEGIKSGGKFSYRRYDCKLQELGDAIPVTPKRLNLIEGSYSMHPKLIALYDLKIFLDISAEEQSARILARNGPAMHDRFIGEWIPMEERYFKQMNIKEKADIIFGE